MTTDRELMQQALDALEEAGLMIGYKESGLKLQNALRARLAQPEQEPLWIRNEEGKLELHAPPQREWCQCKDAPNDCTYEKNCRVPQIDAAFKRIEWQGLTDKEIVEIAATPAAIPGAYVHCFARAIEAKLKEKNGF